MTGTNYHELCAAVGHLYLSLSAELRAARHVADELKSKLEAAERERDQALALLTKAAND